MPMLLELVNKRPDDAVDQGVSDAVQRAKDVWGLEYADDSQGLYPSGNQIGRGTLRVDHLFDRTATQSQSQSIRRNGGRWATVTGAATLTGVIPLDTDAGAGWVDWLNFTTDQDAFIVWEGAFNWDVTPSIHEIRSRLSGMDVPPVSLDVMYTYEKPQGYFEVPVVISPRGSWVLRVRSHLVGGNLVEQFGLLGDLIAKRSYLILEIY